MRQIIPSKANIRAILERVKTVLEQRQYQKSVTINFEELNKTIIQKNAIVPRITITDEAWQKMTTLVQKCDLEVGFHGVVEKNENNYLITDILVYPQKVSAATVTTDETELCKWQLTIPTETYNKIRMQGHSHVNMAVSPSGTDHQTYQKILEILGKDDFYLFLIINKRGNIWMQFFDMKQNILFENKDLELERCSTDADAWVDEQLKLVKKPDYKRIYPQSIYSLDGELPFTQQEMELEKAWFDNINKGE